MRLTDLSMRAPPGPADESVVKVGVAKKHQQVKKEFRCSPRREGIVGSAEFLERHFERNGQ